MITGAVKIGSHCRVGPFTHLRDGTVLEDGVEVGAFVEIKQSHLGQRTIVRHLAYLGDADVGENVNIGATAVTANFDGERKNARPRSATGAASAPARSWSHRSISATTPSSGPTPSSPATRTSPTARPSWACRPGRWSASRRRD